MAALRIQLRQWSPFAEFGEYVVWRGSRALVWIWDAARSQALMAEAGVKTTRVLPESVLHPPLVEGLRSVRCLDGVEGQHWREGVLWDSHWWPEAPELLCWQRFQRSCGGVAGALPKIEEPEWLPAPWGRRQQALMLDSGYQRAGLLAVLAVLGFLVFWQIGVLWKWQRANQELQVRLAASRDAAEPVLKLREQALADREVAERLARLNAYPGQLELMMRIGDALAGVKPNPRFLEWRYNPGTLEVVVEDAGAEPRQYVTALQNLPLVADVTAQPERESGRWRLQVTLRAVAPTLAERGPQ